MTKFDSRVGRLRNMGLKGRWQRGAITRTCTSVAVSCGLLAAAGSAWATDYDTDMGNRLAPEAPASRTAQDEAPVWAFTHSAKGTSAGHYGAAGFGSSTLELSGDLGGDNQFGGGARVWGSPVEGLTLLAEGSRRDNGELAPSVTGQFRLLESGPWSLGALGRYKAEGFAEVEGEVEAGLLGSLSANRLHLDMNLLAGRGFEEEETDGELLLRGGVDVLSALRLGFEGRARYRLVGEIELSGGKSWDAFGGPQITTNVESFFASVLTGPTTIGVVDGIGWGTILTVGGVM